jgi:hypothetical protein
MKKAANKTLSAYIEKAKNKSKGKSLMSTDDNKSMYDIDFKKVLAEQ